MPRQACVIGGWTDPRGSRPFFGALLLGVYDESGRLHLVGHTGAGFADAEIGRVWKRLHPLRSKISPFAATPRTSQRPHWVQPKLVVEVKFSGWSASGKLRHPAYIGIRDDIMPQDVRREPDGAIERHAGRVFTARRASQTGLAPRAEERDRAAERPPKPTLTKAAVRKLLDQIDAIEDK